MKFDPKNTIFLIDGSSFLYRAYYSLRPLQTPAGLQVQAVYGFCRMIKKLLDTFNPHYLALIWDSPGVTIRTQKYADYKATRQAPPNDLFAQKQLIMTFADTVGIKQVWQEGVEADDIMFSLVQDFKKTGHTCVMITSDKDMAQALDEQVLIYDTFKEQMIDTAVLQERYGFPVEKLVFYYALLGDTSDNIPGVKGIGEKGAAELVKHFASLQDMYEHLEQVPKERIRKLLYEQKDNALLSHELFTLIYYPFHLTPQDLAFTMTNWSRARTLFQEWNFKSMLANMHGAADAMLEHKKASLAQYSLITVTQAQQLNDVINAIKTVGGCTIDTEGSGLQPLRDTCCGISVCTQATTAYYIPFGHVTGEQQLAREYVLQELKPLLENPAYHKYLHHAKFDAEVLWEAGIKLNGITFDTLIAAHLLSQEGQRIGLKFLSERYLQQSMITYDELMTQVTTKDFAHVPLALATVYSAADSLQTLRIQHLLAQELAQDPQLEHVFYSIEMPLMHVLCSMEIEGIYVDSQELNALSKAMAHDMSVIEQQIALYRPETQPINLNSPKQVEQLLFHELQLPPQKKSGKGTSFSTDQAVLQTLASLHPVPGLILTYRELAKLKGTYADALPNYINPKTNRIHTQFSQTNVATGRLSSSDPNLQNTPAGSSTYGGAIRAAFKPKPQHIFLSADYSQIELRVLAHYSQDENLINAFTIGLDIHAQTAARLFGVSVDAVTHEQRQIGKRINFSVLYGLTPYGLSQDLRIPFAQAKQYITTYFEQYPKVMQWMETVEEEAKQYGFVRTWQGRRRYIPGIYQDNKTLYEEARRVAINTKAQGTAADIMKIGMIRLHNALQENEIDAQLLLQIHDELLISVRYDQKAVAEQLVKNILEQVTDWNIPLKVTTRCGYNWREVSK